MIWGVAVVVPENQVVVKVMEGAVPVGVTG
jgi:hypothetical protein